MKKLGIIGGSGLELIEGLKEKGEERVISIYGEPSAPYKIYEKNGCVIYFLSRHGENHIFAPHKINYKANAFGFKELGVKQVISFSTTGAINPSYKSGDIIITDDAIDNTCGRDTTFFNDTGKVVHIDMSKPFCPPLRHAVIKAAEQAGVPVIKKGVYICVNGPRFETPAEIKAYRIWGADMVGMTLFPELALLKELGICHANISLITNTASGMDKDKKLTSDEVTAEAAKSKRNIAALIEAVINSDYDNETCRSCSEILKGAEIGKK